MPLHSFGSVLGTSLLIINDGGGIQSMGPGGLKVPLLTTVSSRVHRASGLRSRQSSGVDLEGEKHRACLPPL